MHILIKTLKIWWESMQLIGTSLIITLNPIPWIVWTVLLQIAICKCIKIWLLWVLDRVLTIIMILKLTVTKANVFKNQKIIENNRKSRAKKKANKPKNN